MPNAGYLSSIANDINRALDVRLQAARDLSESALIAYRNMTDEQLSSVYDSFAAAASDGPERADYAICFVSMEQIEQVEAERLAARIAANQERRVADATPHANAVRATMARSRSRAHILAEQRAQEQRHAEMAAEGRAAVEAYQANVEQAEAETAQQAQQARAVAVAAEQQDADNSALTAQQTAQRAAERRTEVERAIVDESRAVETPRAFDARTFVTAGNATFTLSNPAGERFTFRVKQADPDPRYPTRAYFVSQMTGSDNENSYSYLGMLDVATGAVNLRGRTRYTDDSLAVKVIRWSLKQIWAGRAFPDGYTIRHAGRCGRCGRTLTVPSSIDSGIGPDCADIMGL